MRGFIVVFIGVYEIVALSSRIACLPDRQARFGYSRHLYFFLVFMIAAQVARLSGQRHQTTLLNSRALVISKS